MGLPLGPVVGVRDRAAVGFPAIRADCPAHAGRGFFLPVLLREAGIELLASRTDFLLEVIVLINFIVNDCICVVVRVRGAKVSLAKSAVGPRDAGCGFGFFVG